MDLSRLWRRVFQVNIGWYWYMVADLVVAIRFSLENIKGGGIAEWRFAPLADSQD